MRTNWTMPVAGTLITGLLVAASPLLPTYWAGLIVDGLIFSLLALSLNLLLGYAGLPSLGHAAYFGAGAYAAGLTAVHVSDSFWVGSAAGIALALAFGAIYGLLALRTRGVSFLMITLALAQISWAVAFSWRSLTGGDDGLRAIGRPTLGLPGISVAGTTEFLILTILASALTLLLMWAIVRSSFGQTLRGIQQNEPRMDALGYNVWLLKYAAFVVSSGFAGFAGVLFAYYKGFVSPEAVSIVVSAEVTLMVIVGGAGTLLGPFVGGFAIVLLSNIISGYSERWLLMLGMLYVAVVLLAPQGLVVFAKSAWNHRRRRPS